MDFPYCLQIFARDKTLRVILFTTMLTHMEKLFTKLPLVTELFTILGTHHHTHKGVTSDHR